MSKPLQLGPPSNRHLLELMTWFGDEVSLRTWGGPLFRYPFSKESFLEDLRLDAMASYVLVTPGEEMIGFGQTYPKLGRGHLARLVVSPGHRRKGYGSVLIEQLVRRSIELFCCSEHSLYVLSDNVAARRCYEKLGFRRAASPDGDDLHEKVQFMVRQIP